MEKNENRRDPLQLLDVNSHNLEDILKALDNAKTNTTNDIYYLVIINSKTGQNTIKVPNLKETKGKILIPLQDGFEVINKADIVYCEADDNYSKIYLRNGEKYMVSKTLKYFEDSLGTESFVRVHKSFLVNANDIVKYYRKGKTGNLKLSNGEYIPVSASKKPNLMAYFKSHS